MTLHFALDPIQAPHFGVWSASTDVVVVSEHWSLWAWQTSYTCIVILLVVVTTCRSKHPLHFVCNSSLLSWWCSSCEIGIARLKIPLRLRGVGVSRGCCACWRRLAYSGSRWRNPAPIVFHIFCKSWTPRSVESRRSKIKVISRRSKSLQLSSEFQFTWLIHPLQQGRLNVVKKGEPCDHILQAIIINRVSFYFSNYVISFEISPTLGDLFWNLFTTLHPEIKSFHRNTLNKQFEDKLTLANLQVPQELQSPNPEHQDRLNLVDVKW